MHMVRLAFSPRFVVYTLCILFTAALLATVLAAPSWFAVAGVPLVLFGGLTILGTPT